MNRLRDEVRAGLINDSQDTQKSASNMSEAKAYQKQGNKKRSMFQVNANQPSESGQSNSNYLLGVDSELLQMTAENNGLDGKSQNPSQLTSNVDSVYSFYGQKGGNPDESQSENIPEGTQPKLPGYIDLKMLNDEINASILTSTTFSTKHQNFLKQKKKLEHLQSGKSPNKPIELFTFLQSKTHKTNCRLNKKSTVFQDFYCKKYNLSTQSLETTEMSNLTRLNNMSEANSHVSFNNQQSNNDSQSQQKQETKMFIMGGDKRMEKYQGIYIDPKINEKKKVTPKKKSSQSNGKDMRYQMKQFEQVSKFSSDDFFFGNITNTQPNQRSQKVIHEEQVEESITHQELQNAQKYSIEEQSQNIQKRQKLNRSQETRRFVMRDKNLNQPFTQQNIYFDDLLDYPIYSWNQILAFRHGAKLTKINQGHVLQLKQCMIYGPNHNLGNIVKKEDQTPLSSQNLNLSQKEENSKVLEDDKKLKDSLANTIQSYRNMKVEDIDFKIIAIERNCSLTTLIGCITPTIFAKVLVNPVLNKTDLKNNQHIKLKSSQVYDICSSVNSNQYNQSFQSKEDFQHKFQIKYVIVPSEIQVSQTQQSLSQNSQQKQTEIITQNLIKYKRLERESQQTPTKYKIKLSASALKMKEERRSAQKQLVQGLIKKKKKTSDEERSQDTQDNDNEGDDVDIDMNEVDDDQPLNDGGKIDDDEEELDNVDDEEPHSMGVSSDEEDEDDEQIDKKEQKILNTDKEKQPKTENSKAKISSQSKPSQENEQKKSTADKIKSQNDDSEEDDEEMQEDNGEEQKDQSLSPPSSDDDEVDGLDEEDERMSVDIDQ